MGAFSPPDAEIAFPRVCAHRGFNTVAPENSLAALGLAVALGASEIEFDLWPSRDGVFFACHDDTVDRVSSGQGRVVDMTADEIEALDIGMRFSPHFSGLRMPRFEDILRRFGRRAIMNIHIKPPAGWAEYRVDAFERLADLIYRYDCARHVYIAGHASVLKTARAVAPDLTRCCLDGTRDYTLVDTALEYECGRIQLFKPYFNQAMIDRAHQNGIRVNIFYANDADEAKRYLDMGIDTILTDDYLPIKSALAGRVV